MTSPIVFAGLAPHPPLLVPDVGGSRIADVANSQEAMRIFCKKLVESNPDSIVIISPHSPLDPNAFSSRTSPILTGDFRDFSAPGVWLEFKNDLALLGSIKRAAMEEGITIRELAREHTLDHGALVPLYYIHEAGWSGPIVVFGYTYLSNSIHLAFGRAIKQAAESTGRHIAIVASGDMSHRLKVDGPYEYEPTAHLFDEHMVKSIKEGDAKSIIGVDDTLRERAGECGYRSLLVAIGAADENISGSEVLSYEGPFGVGYLVAVLKN